MLLIADSGSTKTSWRLIAPNNTFHDFATEGYNPHYKSSAEIQSGLKKDFLPQLNIKPENIQEVHFYGAGISTDVDVANVQDALFHVFNESNIHVEHDLLAAARALCLRDEGIACILGTGSNSCLYNGKKIIDNIPALGFTLGDEGGGSGIGRELIKSFFYREMPKDLHQAFDEEYQLDKAKLFWHVYYQPAANRYIANFSKFCYTHRSHPFIHQLLENCFDEFIRRKVKPYANAENIPVGFIGSVAWHFSELLGNCLKKQELIPGSFIRNPLDRLTDYHLKSV